MKLVGILNVTPDSFSDGGFYVGPPHGRRTGPQRALEQALRLEREGADWLDIGGESSRPGAEPVSPEEELERVIPVIRKVRAHSRIPISVDTTKARVAVAALEAGANAINDISAGGADPEMFSVAARFRVPIVLMHMRGTPKTMQEGPFYKDVVAEIREFFMERKAVALAAGILPEHLIFDPGIGFGKRPEDNLAILKNLAALRVEKFPLYVGASRKSFIGALTGAGVTERLPGSLAAAAVCLRHADYLRVHDVAATRQFLEVLGKLL